MFHKGEVWLASSCGRDVGQPIQHKLCGSSSAAMEGVKKGVDMHSECRRTLHPGIGLPELLVSDQ